MTAADVFGSCRFHFGAIDEFARNNPSIAAELDFFTPGWMGVRDTFDQSYVCDDTAPGGPLEGLVPVVVAYVAAFYAKRHNGLNDCNVGSPDLCTHGALYIKQNLEFHTARNDLVGGTTPRATPAATEPSVPSFSRWNRTTFNTPTTARPTP